jgi:hypothetical protein
MAKYLDYYAKYRYTVIKIEINRRKLYINGESNIFLVT